MTKKSTKPMKVYTGNGPFVLMSGTSAEEVGKMLQVIELMHSRIVIHTEREEVMKLFLLLHSRENEAFDKKGIRKLTQFLYLIFDFRAFKSPTRSLSIQTLETELFNLKKKIEGRDE